jgi:hypothetical protein
MTKETAETGPLPRRALFGLALGALATLALPSAPAEAAVLVVRRHRPAVVVVRRRRRRGVLIVR